MPSVVIIGGNHGLGLAWTKHYLNMGWNVTATYRERDLSDELLRRCEE